MKISVVAVLISLISDTVTSVMHFGRDKIFMDVTLKLALTDQLTQFKVFKLLTPQMTFGLCTKLYLFI